MSMSTDEEKSVSSVKSQPQLQPSKRRPETDLNHDNWDQEDEPEEKGEFKKATEDELKDRKILTARRKQKPAEQPSNNPFGAVNLTSTFSTKNNGNTAVNQNPLSMFNFACTAAAAAAPKFDFSCITSTASGFHEKTPTPSQTSESNVGDSKSSDKTPSSSSGVVEKAAQQQEPRNENTESEGVKFSDSSNDYSTLDQEASLTLSPKSTDKDSEEDSREPVSETSASAAPEDDNDNSATNE